MKRYQNISGSSGVKAFETGPDYINVLFVDGHVYQYTYGVTGASNIERMKELAEEGKGLSTFISQFVRDKYAWKKRHGS